MFPGMPSTGAIEIEVSGGNAAVWNAMKLDGSALPSSTLNTTKRSLACVLGADCASRTACIIAVLPVPTAAQVPDPRSAEADAQYQDRYSRSLQEHYQHVWEAPEGVQPHHAYSG